MANALVIVDEGHMLLPNPSPAMVAPLIKLWEASKVLFLSATFGDAFGLETIKGVLAKVTPLHKTLYVRPDGMGPADRFSKIHLSLLNYRESQNPKVSRWSKLPSGMLPSLVAEMIKMQIQQELPTVIVAPTPEYAELVHRKLCLYLTDDRTESQAESNLLGKPRLFTGAVDHAITSVFANIHKGAMDDTKVIVTSYEAAIGVNFWPRCFLCSTHIPWTPQVWDQVIGRCDRQDPNGLRFVAWPLTA